MFFLMIGFIKRNVRGFETQCHSECGHAWGDKHGPNAHDGGAWSPRDGTRTPKIIVLRDYVVLRIAV